MGSGREEAGDGRFEVPNGPRTKTARQSLSQEHEADILTCINILKTEITVKVLLFIVKCSPVSETAVLY
jgi:hypothetical protein